MHLYIHIPFCKQKCSYCSFNSSNYSIDIQNQYILSLLKEIDYIISNYGISNLKTIYIGGGTPSSLSDKNLEILLSYLESNLSLDSILEYTIECNPESVTRNFLDIISKFSINRVSMGVQSTNNNTLRFLNRIHNKKQVQDAISLLKEYSINNFNLDLIFSIPNQSEESLLKSLEDIVSFKPTHISCYSLIFEEGTYLYTLKEKGLIKENDDDIFVDQYRFIIDFLKKNGYHQYEISNFCKKNKFSIHNSAYWQNKNYIGVGVSSHSKHNNVRYSNIDDILSYISIYNNDTKNNSLSYTNNFKEKINFPFTPSTKFNDIDILDEKDIFNEYLILGLRQNIGIDLNKINSFFTNRDLIEYKNSFFNILESIIEQGYLLKKDDMICFTQTGREISNTIYTQLML